MRPIRLRMKGFTAFRDEQELDLSGLDLFALWGPTGSGKSSVLDAITYALYGKAERVEGVREVSLAELVSHGQKRMAVTLEFDVGGTRYMVTRTTPRSGSSTARLEVNEGADWRSFGEGADRVREVNAAIQGLIGLNYDAFTRSVILPQGKFAEFLTGDAADRRKILIELLGLELFGKMAAHANGIVRDARIAVETSQKIIDDGFSDVTDEALTSAQLAATTASTRAAEMEKVEKTVTALARRAEDIERGGAEIARCAAQASELATTFSGHIEKLIRAAATVAELDDRLDAARVDIEKATDATDGARSDLAKAETEFGTRDSLIRLKGRLEVLDACRHELESAAAAQVVARAALDGATTTLSDAERLAIATSAEATKAREKLRLAQAALEEANRGDLVAALSRELAVGDPCPVCGGAIETLPQIEAHALEKAVADAEAATDAARNADRAAADADRSVAVARNALESARAEVDRCDREAELRDAAVKEIEVEIATTFGGRAPGDPRGELDRRITEIDELAEAVAVAVERKTEADKALASLERAKDKAEGEVATIRAAMVGARVDALMRDSSAVLAGDPIVVPTGPPSEDTTGLIEGARATATALTTLQQRLESARAERERELASLVAQASERLPEEERPAADDIGAVAAVATELRNQARDDAVRKATEAAKVADELERKRTLEAEVESRRHERDLYAELANELRTDRIVDFLQSEALVALAAGGSDHLERLSDHRYRLVYENDRFYVVDAWNAEERRSVRTLSGGETFLASLALALALAEGVQMLAVTEKHRLESLFLDEGFGTLDTETLKAVVDALERLGQEDRLVGVITHVTSLAEEMPVRIEVVKSQHGSALRIAAASAGDL
jgi:exonuclease SbcC